MISPPSFKKDPNEERHASAPHEDHDYAAEHDEAGELWVVSYADMMTLLFGFFAMMFSFASFDSEDYIRISKQMAKYFGGDYVSPVKELSQKIEAQWAKSPYKDGMSMKATDDGMDITFTSSMMFGSGSAEVNPEVLEPVNSLIGLVQESKMDVTVAVEGHTDNIPISTARFPSNWELSAARATAIVRMFLGKGFAANRLGATGYGDSRPAVPNDAADGTHIAENQAKNRRVVLKIIPEKIVNPLKDVVVNAEGKVEAPAAVPAEPAAPPAEAAKP